MSADATTAAASGMGDCREFVVLSSYLLYDNSLDSRVPVGLQRSQVGRSVGLGGEREGRYAVD